LGLVNNSTQPTVLTNLQSRDIRAL
jgi:hypothetical protein